MFKNAGGKIMALAKIMFFVFAVAAIGGGISAGRAVGYFSTVLGVFVFLIVAACGVFSAWVGALAVYAFGELCENTRLMREGMGYSAPQEQQINFKQMAGRVGMNNAGGQYSSQYGNQSQPQPMQMNNPYSGGNSGGSMASSQWICPNCGKPNGPENAFCTGCGCTKN